MDFASVPDKYLALTGEGGMEQETEVLYDKINGIGTHEVVIESPNHNSELELLPQRLIKVAAMGNEKKFRIAIRVPEIFYVLRNHESLEPDSFIAEAELIKKHQSEEPDEPVSVEVQLGRDQIDAICRVLQSEFTTETKNITSFKSYVHNLDSNTLKMAIQEVENFLQEMRNLEQDYKGDNIYKFFQEHWAQYGEDFYFIVKSIDLAGIRVVRDSSLLEQLSDDQKIEIYLEVY